MRPLVHHLLAGAVLSAFASIAHAQSTPTVAGTWVVRPAARAPDGSSPPPSTMTLSQRGDSVTGTFARRGAPPRAIHGTIVGGDLRLESLANASLQNDASQRGLRVRINYVLRLVGDSLVGTSRLESLGDPADGGLSLNGMDQPFVAVRGIPVKPSGS